ncbi:MAG: selenoneine biosynthesis selenosugar synthase SenB [Pseudomonadota bacterium]
MLLPKIEIVTPYAADANNGNWRTAARWARLLRNHCNVIVQSDWRPGRHAEDADCLIALHARRSHAAISDWRGRYHGKPLVVVLTGTDLYRDLPDDAQARESLRLADRLIVLQEDAPRFLPRGERAKARVVYQSAYTLKPAEKKSRRLNCIQVGHLRAEKDPLTALAAWDNLPAQEPIFLLHVGGALDRELGRAARAFAHRERRYRWVGEQPNAWTRQAIKRAHLLLVPSIMEGGANVIVEAVTAGTPVLASRMSGNVGMLGADYAGMFPVGSARALAGLLRQCRAEPAFYNRLVSQCRVRSALFRPARERASLLGVIRELV